MVVDKYTQIRQRWLRVKIVKSNHGKHCKKKALTVYNNNNDGEENDRIENLKTKK